MDICHPSVTQGYDRVSLVRPGADVKIEISYGVIDVIPLSYEIMFTIILFDTQRVLYFARSVLMLVYNICELYFEQIRRNHNHVP